MAQFAEIRAAFRVCGLRLGDTHLALDRLCRYPVVFVQSADFLDTSDARRLVDYVDSGASWCSAPVCPISTRISAPVTCSATRAFVQLPKRTSSLRSPKAVPPPEFRVDDSRLDLVVHASNGQQLLFVW